DDDDDDTEEPWERSWEDSEEIMTYAAALKKVDENKVALTGAKFTFAGVTAEKNEDGVYTVTSTKATAGNETEMEVGSDGKLYIIGLAQAFELVGTETVAPAGYNKLSTTFGFRPQLMGKTIYKSSGSVKYDAKGNVVEASSTFESQTTVSKNLDELDAAAVEVENNKGVELPSTGGIGTTIFYVGGSLMVLAAAILLITKRRMGAED
ncbi:MAG: LPXTG cell wall anchor domain-containing protein, partial [bacterium]